MRRWLLLVLLLACAPAPVLAQTTLVCVPASDVEGNGDWSGSTMWDETNETNSSTLAGHDSTTTQIVNSTGFNVYAIVMKDAGCAIPAGATGISVRVALMAQDGGPAANCSIRLRIGTTNHESEGAVALQDAFSLETDDWPTNPVGAAAWTVDTANGSGGTNPITGFGARCEDGTQITAMAIIYTYTPGAGGSTGHTRMTLLGVGL